MKTILGHIRTTGRANLPCFSIIGYDDGSMTVRIDGSGLMGPAEAQTLHGLKVLFDWADTAIGTKLAPMPLRIPR
jgi:hypothetical protein